VIKLSKEQEPDIWNALQFGSVLENVVYEQKTHLVDYDNISITENTRGSYILDTIPNAKLPATSGQPTNATFLTPGVDKDVRDLVERTQETLRRAINAVKPGRRINVIGRVIEAYARRFGYGVVREFTGHGIGSSFHSGLVIPHFDDPHYDTVIEPGMTFTIEPMLNLGTHTWDMWDDDWTAVTLDGRRSAQFEHTLLITEVGCEVLTVASNGQVPAEVFAAVVTV
jgi:methionine aminopeptidase